MVDYDNREARAREAVRRTLRKAGPLFTKEGNRRWSRLLLAAQDPIFLVEAAREGDVDAIEFLRNYARGARRTGMKVPPAMEEFVWEYFIDGAPKAPPGRSTKDSALRNQAIATLVYIVSRDYGFPEYRNAEYRGAKAGPMSACRLVAEELGLAEDTVEEIWRERKAGIVQAG